ncbi:sulfotransferase family protein [Frateuria aurantia]
MKRTFIVGCPRSGTTVVQAMLGRHPDVFTLPETGFFPRLIGGLPYRLGDEGTHAPSRTLARRLGLTRSYARLQFEALQQSLQPGEPAIRTPWLQRHCIEQVIGILDQLARRADRAMWIEKTPLHLLYLPEIEHYLPDARIIHVIRPGIDVLASITDADMRYDHNKSFSGGLNRWVQRWNLAADIHRSRIGQPNHHLVFLEDLVRDPTGEWDALRQFLGLPGQVELDQVCQQTIADPSSEPWKQAALSGQPRQSESKVEMLFGPQLHNWLQEQLHSYADLYAAAHQGPSRVPGSAMLESGNATHRAA